jgi:hypothetical protein
MGQSALLVLILTLGVLGAYVFAVAWSRSIVRGAGFMPDQQPRWSWHIERALRRLYLRYSGRPPGEAWHDWALKAHYPDQALAYLEFAAQANWPDAHFELGLLYDQAGSGGGGRHAAARHYLAAAQRGHAEAAFRLAELLRWGTQDAKDPEGARRWYLHSARLGFAPAMAWVAQAMETGDGFPVDLNGADAWKARLEAHGLGTTLRRPPPLGREGRGGAWWREALQESAEALAELPGFMTSARWLTRILVFVLPLGLLGVAALLFLRAGIFGVVFAIPAVVSLGGLTLLHINQRRHMNMSRAGATTQAAAEQGDPEACHRLGLSCLHGDHDRPSDTVAARRWLLQAALEGHLDAMAEVGELLAWGVGGPKDAAGGLAWLQRAAAAGHGGAQAQLNRMAVPEGDPEP